MIRFVDMREADIVGGRFSFFNTVTDKYVEIQTSQAWSDWGDFEFHTDGDITEAFKGRLKNTCPSWVFETYVGDYE